MMGDETIMKLNDLTTLDQLGDFPSRIQAELVRLHYLSVPTRQGARDPSWFYYMETAR